MKKHIIIALVLAIAAVLCVSVSAAEVTPENIDINKIYTLKGGSAVPTETLSFTVEADENNIADGSTGELVVGENNEFEVSGDSAIPLTFPTYTKVGVYKYTIREVEGSTQGVVYDKTPLIVLVSVTNSQAGDGTSDALDAKVTFHREKDDGEKVSEIRNEYGLGQLTVTKKVSGYYASNEKKFTIKVTFTGEDVASDISYTVAGGEEQTLSFTDGTAEVEIELSNTESALFTNIPVGVTYTVVEDAKHTEGADDPAHTEEGYTVSYANSDNQDTDSGSGKIEEAEEEDTVEITNTKDAEIDTGIFLDSLPYFTVTLLVLCGAVLMVLSRRRSTEN